MILFPRGTKAVMGIGMLFIFVATVIASAVAAAVLISATETIQERAFIVQEEATERLLTGFDIVAVYVEGDSSTGLIDNIEVIVRLRSGSQAIDVDNVGFSYNSGNVSLSASLNNSKINSACSFSSVTDEAEFCMKQLFADNTTIMQTGDMASLLYSLAPSSAMTTEQDFTLILQTPKGATQVLELRTPNLILDARNKLR